MDGFDFEDSLGSLGESDNDQPQEPLPKKSNLKDMFSDDSEPPKTLNGKAPSFSPEQAKTSGNYHSNNSVSPVKKENSGSNSYMQPTNVTHNKPDKSESEIKSEIDDYEDDFDDFESDNKPDDLPVKTIKNQPKKFESPNGLFAKPKLEGVPSLRSSVHDTVAKTIRGNKAPPAPENTAKFTPFEEKKNDFFDRRAKPVVQSMTKDHVQPKKNVFALDSDKDDSDDYDDDFDLQEDNINKVADNILTNIKSPQAEQKTPAPSLHNRAKFIPVKPQKIQSKTYEEKKTKSVPRKSRRHQASKTEANPQIPKTVPKKKPARQTRVKTERKTPKKALKSTPISKTPVEKPSVNPVAMQRLMNSNTDLLQEIHELSKQVDLRMVSMHRKEKQAPVDEVELNKTNKEKMKERAKKIKRMKKEISDMYSELESTYKNNKLTEMENELRQQKKLMHKQENQMKDYNKAIKRMIHLTKPKDQSEFTGDVESHYEQAKTKLRDLKEKYRSIDIKLKSKHLEVETMKNKTKFIKDLIHEKKRLESASGMKHNAKQEDVDEVAQNIENLEEKRTSQLKHFRSVIQNQEKDIKWVKKIIKKCKKEIKKKEDERRKVQLNIQQLKRHANKSSMGSAKKKPKSVHRKPLYETPSKPLKNPIQKRKVAKSINRKKRGNHNADFSVLKSSDNLETSIESKKVKNVFKDITLEMKPEEDYPSEFEDDSISVAHSKQEIKNIMARHELPQANKTQETSQMSNITQTSPPLQPQKIDAPKRSSKPNFMMKRKF
ncbi:unnamed protein product [Moneuplotes crassus]|uniref:Uncharacterized protein n=1 Tax=Euplotes crassus TaxID=5936 RepID=A0AAD2D8L7_EUPCR|nr:unnamed protein product [Moneuplotes crassus]